MVNPLSILRQWAYRGYRDSQIEEHELKYLFLEITRRCNLSCLHCGSDCKSSSTTKELSTDSWLSIINYVKAAFNPAPVIILTGGEPLVHRELYAITERLHQQNLRWSMVSNGMALSEKVLHRLVQNGIESITISIDGGEESHNYLRNHPKSFNRVKESLELIGKSSIPIKDAVTCVYGKNLHELDSLASMLIDVGITSWRLFRIFPLGRAEENMELHLTKDETWSMIEWIRINRAKYQLKGLDISLSCEGYIPFDVDRQVRDEPFFCRSGINYASILSDGNITGCSNNPEKLYQGNIMERDLRDIWDNGFQDIRRRQFVSDFCKGCAEFKNCLGGSVHLWDHDNNRPLFCYLI